MSRDAMSKKEEIRENRDEQVWKFNKIDKNWEMIDVWPLESEFQVIKNLFNFLHSIKSAQKIV